MGTLKMNFTYFKSIIYLHEFCFLRGGGFSLNAVKREHLFLFLFKMHKLNNSTEMSIV